MSSDPATSASLPPRPPRRANTPTATPTRCPRLTAPAVRRYMLETTEHKLNLVPTWTSNLKIDYFMILLARHPGGDAGGGLARSEPMGLHDHCSGRFLRKTFFFLHLFDLREAGPWCFVFFLGGGRAALLDCFESPSQKKICSTALLSTAWAARLIRAGHAAQSGWRRRMCARPCCA
jgi:hypothetical protein